MKRLGMQRQGTARWRGGELLWHAIDRDAWLAARPTAGAVSARTPTSSR
jgi:hypothetical protein